MVSHQQRPRSRAPYVSPARVYVVAVYFDADSSFYVCGHLIFSHYSYFDVYLNEVLPKPDDWSTYKRISHRYSQGQRIAYPSQNSIAALPEEEQSKCLQGVFKAVLQAYDGVPMGKPKKLDEWNVRNLGERLADILMRLHNFKSGLLLPPRYDCFSIV